MRKFRVGVLFGGKSAEHEVSLQSARNVIDAIDRERYEVVPIGIDRDGRWFVGDEAHLLVDADDPAHVHLERPEEDLAVVPGNSEHALVAPGAAEASIDVAFPVLHGPYGEDGAVQGLLELAGIPFVGAGVLGSAVGMDKDVMKRLLRDAGVPIGEFVSFRRHERDAWSFDDVAAALGTPVYVKPANLGSSVGVHRVTERDAWDGALDDAFCYDNKVVVEANISGREVECSVLGNEHPEASVVGEILTGGDHDFYSYDAKYIDEKGAALQIPADLPHDVADLVRSLAIRTFQVLECEGLARVDSFVAEDGSVFVNEINTLPGFTNISMYTKLWEASGLTQTQLIDRLIQLAFARHERDAALKTTR